MVKQTTAAVKREFEAFSEKVARLEELRHELELLDTTGFEKEVVAIKSKLKDITALPIIERLLRDLRVKVARHHERASQTVISTSVVGSLKRRIGQLEAMIKEKKQLSAKDAHYLKELPGLERQLLSLRKKISQHLHARKISIDSGVGLLVDTTFDEFVQRIKSELTERLHEKQGSLDHQMQSDLQAREELFAQRYQTLVQELHERYTRELAEGMHREVKAHLHEEVAKRIALERKKLVSMLLQESAQRLQRERAEQLRRLEASYRGKEAQLHAQYVGEKDKLYAGVRTERARLAERIRLVNEAERTLGIKQQTLTSALRREHAQLQRERTSLQHTRSSLARQARVQARKLVGKMKQRVSADAKSLHHQLILQREHMQSHLAALRAKEHLVAEHERSARAQLAHEKELLAEAYTSLQSREHRIMERATQRSARQRALLQARISRERVALRTHERELHARERTLTQSLATLRNKMREKIVSLQTDLQEAQKKREEVLSSMATTTKAKMKSAVRAERTRALEKLRAVQAELSAQREHYRALQKSVAVRSRALVAHKRLLDASVMNEKKVLRDKVARLVHHERHIHAKLESSFARRLAIAQQQAQQHYRQQLIAHKQSMRKQFAERIMGLQKHFAAQAEREARAKEQAIRVSLEQEYQQKLHNELARKQVLIDKKKADLERHVLAQAKKLFH